MVIILISGKVKSNPMISFFTRGSVSWLIASCLLWPSFHISTAYSQETPHQNERNAIEQYYRFAINGGSLGQALMVFSRTTGIDLIFNGVLDSNAQVPALNGELEAAAALNQLLFGSNLQWRFTAPNSVILYVGTDSADNNVILLDTVKVEANSLAIAVEKEHVYQKAAAVAVVTAEEIQRQPPRNTSDVLRNVAGVYTSQPRTDPGVSVNIRGMQDFGRVNVMLDGVRQNFQKTGHGSNGQVYLDPSLLAGVDITKGLSSTAGGAGAIAGVVNFRTLEPQDLLTDDKNTAGRLTLSSGSNAYDFSGNTAYARRFSEQFEMIAAISGKKIGAFEAGAHNPNNISSAKNSQIITDTGQEQLSGLLKGRWFINKELMVGLDYIGFDADFGQTQSGNYTAYNVRTDTLKALFSWAPSTVKWLEATGSFYYTVTKRNEARFYENESIDGTASYQNAANFRTYYETNTVGGTLDNHTGFDLANWQVQWVNGGEFFYDWTDPHAIGNAALEAVGNFDSAWYAGSTPKGKRLVTSVFSEATFDYQEWLQLVAGLRYDYYKLEGSGEFFVGSVINPPGVRPPVTRINTSFEVDRSKGVLAPNLKLAIKPIEPLQFYASYGFGFRPPAITETFFSGGHVGNMWANYPGISLKAEEATTIEVGSNLVLESVFRKDDFMGLKLSWFDTRVDNYIVDAKVMGPVDTVSGGLFANSAFVNLTNEVTFKGHELSLDYDAGVAFAQLAYTHTEVDLGARTYNPFPLGSWVGYPVTELGQPSSGGAGIGLVNIFYVGPPEDKVITSLGTRLFDKKVELGIRHRYERVTNSADWMSESQPRLQLWDFWASWQPLDALTLRLSVDNLRDTNHLEPMGSGYAYIGPGRTVIGAITFTF